MVLVSEEKNKRSYKIRKDKKGAEARIVLASFDDPVAYDAALCLVAEYVKAGEPVPDPLRSWAYFVLTGKLERPKLKGKYPPALQWRDETIVELVREVSRTFDLPPTAAGDDGGESACGAVAEALRLMRLQPDSYQQVRRIWKNRNQPPKLPDWAL